MSVNGIAFNPIPAMSHILLNRSHAVLSSEHIIGNLIKLGPKPEVISILEKLLSHSDSEVVKEAAEALGQLGARDKAIPVLIARIP